MKVTTEELGPCEVQLTATFEAKKTEQLLKKTARKLSREYSIRGFRRGKAPYKVVLRRLGEETVYQQAFEDEGEQLVSQALQEADITPYAQIEMESISWNPLMFTLRIPTSPKVELSDYRDIRLETDPFDEVTEEDINEVLEKFQERTATWVPVERPAELGDMAAIVLTEKAGDELITDNETMDYTLEYTEEVEDTTEEESEESEESEEIDSASLDKRFVDTLVGMQKDDERSYTVQYPEDAEDKLYAGKEITVSVTVTAVKERQVDPIDDELARSVTEFETLEAWREFIASQLREQRKQQQRTALGQKMLMKIVEEAPTIEWPRRIEEDMLDTELKNRVQQFEQMGLQFDDLLRIENITSEDWREQNRSEIKESIKTSLVAQQIAELEQLQISQSDVLERAKYISEINGYGDRLWQHIMTSKKHQQELASELLQEKITERLAAISQGETVETSENGPEDAPSEAEPSSEETETNP